MKKVRVLILTVFLAIAFCSCGIKQTDAGGSILVEPGEGTDERNSADQIVVGTDHISEETAAAFKDIETEETEAAFVRMVMLNDKIYTDTGEISHIGRCGVMDFSFDSSVEQGEPQENYQTNFGSGYNGQYGMRDNRIDIYVDDEWHVFANNENNFDGVTMKVTENTNHSLTLEISNDTDLDVQYGEDYSLEVFDGEISTWVPVCYLNPDIAFHAIAYVVPKDSPSMWSADWTQMYGELEAGKYRIVKTVNDFYGTGDYTTYTLTAEFEITDETEEGY